MMPGAGTSRTATLLVVVSVAAGVALLGSTTGSIRGTLVSAAAGALLGIAVLSRTRESPLGTGVASLLAPAIAVLAVGGLGLSILDAGVGDLLAGNADLAGTLRALVVALGTGTAAGFGAFGAVGTLRDGIGEGAVSRVWQSTVSTTVVIAVALGAVLAPRFDALSALPLPRVPLSSVLDPVLSPVDAWIGLVTFWLLIAALGQVARLALDGLPIVELAPRTRRERVANALERVDAVLSTVVVLAVLLGIATGGLIASGSTGEVLAAAPALADVLVLLATPGPRVAIAGLIAVLGGVALLVGAIQRLAGSAASTMRAYLPSVAGGVLACLLALLVAPLVPRTLATLPAGSREPAREAVRVLSPLGAVLGVLAVASLFLSMLLAAIAFAGALRYVPSRAAGSAIAAGGLIVGALGVGAAGDAPLVVFAVVALAVLAWDAGERGVVTRSELGARPPAHLDVVHAVGSLAVATLGTAIAWLLYANALDSVAVPGGNLVGAIATIGASLLLLGVLRG